MTARTSNTGDGRTNVATYREEEMDIYDNMPPALREVIMYGPYAYALREVQEVIKADGLTLWQSIGVVRDVYVMEVAQAYREMGVTGETLKEFMNLHKREWEKNGQKFY